MNSNKYYIGIIVRVILIVIVSLTLAFVSFKTNYFYSIVGLIIVVSIQTWNLINYILKRRDELKRMLEYIKENNPTMYFSQSRTYPFNELGYFLNEVGDIVREVRIEKENQFRYTQYIVENISIGLFAFDQNGKIEIINTAAKRLLGIPEIKSVDLLEKVLPELPETLKKMNPADQKVIVFKTKEKIQHLAFRLSLFKIGEKEIKLVSFHDIKNELDEKEMESWQKLIRVLTHEIINSITPVTTLTGTIKGFFKSTESISENTIQQTVTGLELIEERGKALIDFVNKFRSLTKLPTPKFEEVKVAELIGGIEMLKRNELAEKNIQLQISVDDETRVIVCDRSLIEHVLINLVNNAADALDQNLDQENKTIVIKSFINENQRHVICVIDNGPGIPENLQEEIFIPFFTTKEQGSGIGLSLARQIMRLHGGTITVSSNPGIETEFTLTF
jgi:two-component system, NtrC family, nitrogen regulation sensor histidine kinase NtrY